MRKQKTLPLAEEVMFAALFNGRILISGCLLKLMLILAQMAETSGT